MNEKKALKLTLCIITSIIIFVLLSFQAMAASKPKLSKSKITLRPGKSYTLKLKGYKGKAKWYIKGKKLVTIRTKGRKKHKAVIKAKSKAGTCYIKVKTGKKTLKCKVIVKKKSSSSSEKPFVKKPLSGTSVDLTGSFKRVLPEGLATDDTFSKAYMDTSLAMLKYLNSDASASGKNILISPDSILTCMAMTEVGASGETLAEMKTAFGGVDPDSYYRYLYTLNKRLTGQKYVKYSIADSIWYRKGAIRVNKDFLQKNVNYFNSEVYEAPFDEVTVNDMNNWVYNNTLGMIPSIIDRLDESARLTLINAISFDGDWAEPYEDTTSGKFRTDAGVEQTAKILEGTENTYVEVGGAPGFVKNYKGGDIAFMAFETPSGMSVDKFLSSLNGSDLQAAYKNKKTSNAETAVIVSTKMPEFKYDYSSKLVNTMKELGIRAAFTDAADFSQLSDDSVMIDDIIHKTHIEVTKEGTRAAAATAVIAKANAMPPETYFKKSVDLTHPFVYALIDTKSGLPLFIGALKTLK